MTDSIAAFLIILVCVAALTVISYVSNRLKDKREYEAMPSPGQWVRISTEYCFMPKLAGKLGVVQPYDDVDRRYIRVHVPDMPADYTFQSNIVHFLPREISYIGVRK